MYLEYHLLILSQSLLGNSSTDIKTAQPVDKQLSPVITALSTGSFPLPNTAPGFKHAMFPGGWVILPSFKGTIKAKHPFDIHTIMGPLQVTSQGKQVCPSCDGLV